MHVAALDGQLQVDGERLPLDTVAVNVVGERIGAVGNGLDVGAHQPLRACLHLGNGLEHRLLAVAVEEGGQPFGTDVEGP